MDSRQAAKHSAKDDNGLFQKLRPNVYPIKDDGDMDKNNNNNENKADSMEDTGKENVEEAKEQHQQDTTNIKEKIASEEEDNGRTKAKQELDSILKESPGRQICHYCPFSLCPPANLYACTVTIFSKSHCPYSAKAKSILRNKYLITPTPQVIELNLHPTGADLQHLLGEMTGRYSVPNVMVNGRSIGGGDDVAALDRKGELIETVRSVGGDLIGEVKLRDGDADKSG